MACNIQIIWLYILISLLCFFHNFKQRHHFILLCTYGDLFCGRWSKTLNSVHMRLHKILKKEAFFLYKKLVFPKNKFLVPSTQNNPNCTIRIEPKKSIRIPLFKMFIISLDRRSHIQFYTFFCLE